MLGCISPDRPRPPAGQSGRHKAAEIRHVPTVPTGNAASALSLIVCASAISTTSRPSDRVSPATLRFHDTDFLARDLDPLCERAEVIAAIAATVDPHTLLRRPGELADHLRRNRLLA